MRLHFLVSLIRVTSPEYFLLYCFFGVFANHLLSQMVAHPIWQGTAFLEVQAVSESADSFLQLDTV